MLKNCHLSILTHTPNKQPWVCKSALHENRIIEAVQAGKRSRKAIAVYLGLSYTYTAELVSLLVEAEVFFEKGRKLYLTKVERLG
jgi:hypothetical protein